MVADAKKEAFEMPTIHHITGKFQEIIAQSQKGKEIKGTESKTCFNFFIVCRTQNYTLAEEIVFVKKAENVGNDIYCPTIP